MEARSLASINYLAANPPQYPVNPAEERPEPLTLYISRVPGTRDVILSPYKPGLKNVTAQDVASSLYYIHLELPSASTTNLPNPTEERASHSEDGDRHDAIPRKPLPQEAAQVTPERSAEHLPASGMPARKPVPRSISPATPTNEDNTNPALRPHPEPALVGDGPEELPPPEPKSLLTPAMDGMPARRPLGPRSMQPDRPLSLADEKQALADRQFPRLDHPSSDLPRLPQDGFEAHGSVYVADHKARPRSRNRSQSLGKPFSAPSVHANRQPSLVSEAPAAPVGSVAPTFSLSVIRRDPGSGHQWNVGHVSSQYADASLGPLHQPSYPPIDVQIENTGYSKFRNMPLAPASSGDGAEAMLQALVGRSHEPLSDEIKNMVQEARTASPQEYFSRQVSMAYTKSWTSNIMDKLQKIEKQGWRNSMNNVLHNRSRAGSESTVAPPAQPSVSQEDSTLGGKMRPRGYHFASPWSTDCEFRTGNNGRSVKCFHTIQDSGTYNPLVDGNGDEDDDGEQKPRNGNGARIVSELRFNLPSGDIFSPPSSKDNDLAAAGQRMKGHFSKFLRHGSVDSTASESGEPYYFEEEEEEGGIDRTTVVSPFEVNLGAEKAGGGNRGKRAKLGKLIIHGDGQKMLDLVVAANVGVWWGAWERTV